MASDGKGLTFGTLLIAAMAALGLSSQRTGTPQSSDTTTHGEALSQHAAAGANDHQEHSAAKMLEDFFDTDPEQLQSDKPWSDNAGPATQPRPGYQIRYLIMTIPEPDSKPLRYKFDTYLDAVDEAANSAGFVPDSFDLPWLPGADDKSGEFKLGEPIDVTGTDGPDLSLNLKLNRDKEEETRADRDPGLLLFRSDQADRLFRNDHMDRLIIKAQTERKSLLLIFLIAESPTRGVNRSQLLSALNQIAWLSGWQPQPNKCPPPEIPMSPGSPRQVKILGPTFSGSADSLRLTIDEWNSSFVTAANLTKSSTEPVMIDPTAGESYPTNDCPDPPADKSTPQVCIVSGTATGDISGSLSEQREINFHTMSIPDDQMWPWIIDDLTKGVDEVDPREAPPPLPEPNPTNSKVPQIIVLAEETSYGSIPILENYPSVRRILFPLHISDLRTAFGKSTQQTVPTIPGITRHDLALTDEDSDAEPDVVPAFSKREAMYDELVLSSLLATFHQDRIRYVGIVATDVEDLIFLVHEIRNSSPNTVIFTTNADIRYLHSDVNPDLEGMLVFSSYPLFSHHLAPSDNKTKIEFAGDGAEGVYNALLVLLGYDSQVLDYGVPFRDASSGPALRVGIVGRDAIWPIAFHGKLAVAGAVNEMFQVNNGQLPWNGRGFAPAFFTIAFICLTVICLAFGLIFLGEWPVRIDSRLRDRSRMSWLMGDAIAADLRCKYQSYRAAFALGLLTVYLIGAVFYLPLVRSLWFTPEGLWACLAVLFVLLCAVILIVLFRVALLGLHRVVRYWYRNRIIWHDCGSLVSSAVVFLLSLWLVGSIWSRPIPARLFEYFRASDIWSGVSPLEPLLYLGIAALCLLACNLRRLNLLNECRVKLPFLGFESKDSLTSVDKCNSFTGVDKYERKIVDYLECPPAQLPGAWQIILLLVGASLFFLHFSVNNLKPIDGLAFECFFAVTMFAVYVEFLLLMLRFVWVWVGVHRLLRRLYWHPTRSFYSALRAKGIPDEAEKLHIRVDEPPPSLTAVESCLESARKLLRLVGSANAMTISSRHLSNICKSIESTEKALADALTSQANRGSKRAIEGRLALQQSMASLSALVAAVAEPQWRLLELPSSVSEQKDEQIVETAGMFIAARVVDLLRQVFPQLINLVSFAIIGVLAMMLAVSEYPFPGHDTLLLGSWILLLGTIGTALTVFVQMNRERIVSMLAGTTPGKLNWDSNFVMTVFMVGVLPILALLGAQFPHALGGIFSWAGGIFTGAHS